MHAGTCGADCAHGRRLEVLHETLSGVTSQGPPPTGGCHCAGASPAPAWGAIVGGGEWPAGR